MLIALLAFATAVAAMVTGAVYGRQPTDGGGFTSDVSSSHLKISFGTGMAQLDSISVQEGQQGTGVVTFLGESLAASVSSAIP